MANSRSQTGIIALVTDDASHSDTGGPASHRTIDRVTQILEEVVYHPGIGFAELARALGAPKSSVHGFIRGLQAKGWLYESIRRFYLGPAIYIRTTRVARNTLHHGAQMALASVVRTRAGDSVAAAVIVGQTTEVAHREARLRTVLLAHVDRWSQQKFAAREPI